jgi:hypothetical protein
MPYPGGIFACDGANHWYHTGNARIAVDKRGDHAANSNRQRVCCGHWCKGDKLYWEINETTTANGTGSTIRYSMEYDVYLNTSRPVSASQTLITTGVLSAGGPTCPRRSLLTTCTSTLTARGGEVPAANRHPGVWPAQDRRCGLGHLQGLREPVREYLGADGDSRPRRSHQVGLAC